MSEVTSNAQTSNELFSRKQIGKCAYSGCKEAAFYEIDLDCDDMTALLCNYHHNVILALFGLPDCEGE